MKEIETTIENLQKYNDFDSPKYPILYEGKLWEEEDCDENFVGMYDGKYMLCGVGGIYISDGMVLYPDGSMGDDF